MNIVRKAFTPIEVKLSETGAVSLAFSRFNVIDSDNDVTFPGSMPVGKSVPMSAYGHTSWDGALPIGRGTIKEQDDLGIFEGQFFLATTGGRDAYETVKGLGDLAEYSYGYNVLEGGPGMFEGKHVRELRKLDVFEVSPVLKGAGVGTGTLAIKSGAPASDAPSATRLVWHSDGMKAVLEQLVEHAATRSTDGRKLSRSDRAVLEDLVEAWDGHVAAARSLLASDTPVDPAKQAAFQRAEYENLLAIARQNGVPLG